MAAATRSRASRRSVFETRSSCFDFLGTISSQAGNFAISSLADTSKVATRKTAWFSWKATATSGVFVAFRINFDELDCLPRDEEITAIAAIDLDRVQNMPVGCDDGVLAELEEDAAHRLLRLVGTRGNENRLERLEPRTSQGITVRKEGRHAREFGRVVTT